MNRIRFYLCLWKMLNYYLELAISVSLMCYIRSFLCHPDDYNNIDIRMLKRNKNYLCHAHTDDKHPVFALCRCHVRFLAASSGRQTVPSYTQQQLSRAKIEYMGVWRHSHNV